MDLGLALGSNFTKNEITSIYIILKENELHYINHKAGVQKMTFEIASQSLNNVNNVA